jgi:hypothetical protein
VPDRGEANTDNLTNVIRPAKLCSGVAVRIDNLAGGQLDRATIEARPCLNDWRACKRKRDQCRCEYVVSIFHVILFSFIC